MPQRRFEVRPPAPEQTVFRILTESEASLEDFLSDEQVGRPPSPRENVACYRGISVRATLAQAMKLAKFLRKPAVAEVVLLAEEGDAIARTLSTTGHHTVWADPYKIVDRVAKIHQVES